MRPPTVSNGHFRSGSDNMDGLLSKQTLKLNTVLNAI